MSGSGPVRTPAGVINASPVPASGRRGAMVRVSSIDTWSVMRTGFALSLAIAIVILVAVLSLWVLFEVTGVFDSLSKLIDDVVGESANARAWFGFPRVLAVTVVVGAVEVVLATAAMTLFASLYNLAAGRMGGVEVTLSEDR